MKAGDVVYQPALAETLEGIERFMTEVVPLVGS